MSSVQSLRDFIRKRLTAAAEEIFVEFEKTVLQYEEEIDRQRRLLDIKWNPQLTLHRIEVQKHLIWKEEEVPTNLPDLQLCNQERSSSFNQESSRHPQEESEPPQEPELPQILMEQEEICDSQDQEQLVMKLETDNFMVNPAEKEGDHSELDQNRSQPVFQNSPEAENQVEEGSSTEDSGSNREEELEENLSHPQNRDGRDYVDCSQLKRPKNTPKGKKPFSCPTCGKGARQKSHLLLHMRTHTGEKPFSCHFCEKGFSQRGNLRRHIRTHTGEKPFSCKTCGKVFSVKNSLTRHERTHKRYSDFSQNLQPI